MKHVLLRNYIIIGITITGFVIALLIMVVTNSLRDSKKPHLPILTQETIQKEYSETKFPYIIEKCRFGHGTCVRTMGKNDYVSPGGIGYIGRKSVEEFIGNHTAGVNYILNQGASVADLADQIVFESHFFTAGPKVILTLLYLDNPPYQVLSRKRLPLGERSEEPTAWRRYINHIAQELDAGFYGWMYRNESEVNFEDSRVVFQDGTQIYPPEESNSADVALYRFFAKYYPQEDWNKLVSKTHPGGFYQKYHSLFGYYPDDI